MAIISLFLGIMFLYIAFDIFCIMRGIRTLNKEQREKIYFVEELHAIGNPFNSYKGRSNF